MGRTAIIIILVTIFSNLLGFFRDISLSYFFGASKITDAYFIAYTIPTVLFGIIGYALSTGFIPLFNNIRLKYNNKKANLFTSNTINVLIVVNLLIVMFLMIYTDKLVILFASGFDEKTFNMTVSFVRISLWCLIFLGSINIFKAYLQVHNRILITVAIGIPSNIILILSIYIASKGNITLLPIGILIGTLSQLILLIFILRKVNFKYSPIINFKDRNLMILGKNMLPLILGVSVFHLNTAVGMTLASSTMEGGVSVLNYAQRINGIIEGLFIISIITIMFPKIVDKIQNNNKEAAIIILEKSIRFLLFLVIPAAVGIIFLAEPIVLMMYGRGAFEYNDVMLTSYTVIFYALGTIGYGIREILARVFYSFQDTKTPMYNSIISIFINLILSFVLVHYMGVSGIALATSIATIFSAVLLSLLLKYKRGIDYINNYFILYTFKILFSALFMGIMSKSLFDNLTFNLYISLSISIIVGIIIYLIFSILFKTINVSKIRNFNTKF